MSDSDYEIIPAAEIARIREINRCALRNKLCKEFNAKLREANSLDKNYIMAVPAEFEFIKSDIVKAGYAIDTTDTGMMEIGVYQIVSNFLNIINFFTYHY
jgi:hypothetical protein